MTLSNRNRRIVTYFVRYWPSFIFGAVFLLATNYLGLLIPGHIGDAISTMQAQGISAESVLEACKEHALAIILFSIGAGIARVVSRVQIFNAGRLIEFDVRNELYERLTRLSPSWFGTMATGDLTSRVSNDVNFIRLLYAISFLHIVNTITAYFIALSKMLPLDWELTLICLGPFPVILFATRFIIRALFNQTKIVQAELSNLSSQVQQNLSGVAIVRAYAMEKREKAEFATINDAFVEANIKLISIRGAMQATMTLLAGIGTLAVLYVGAHRVVDNSLTLGQFVEFNGYVVALAFPTIGLGWVFSVWNRGVAAFDRVLDILDAPVDIVDPSDELRLPNHDGPKGSIEFSHVSFGYSEDQPILHDISLSIPAGSTVAIVGRTGSGKTTLARLISRLWDPSQGTIKIDGENLTALSLREARSEIGVVPQDPFLFSMSIENNVRFGLDSLENDPTLHRDAPQLSLGSRDQLTRREQVLQALKIAGLDEDLKTLAKGIDTMVGERGVTLSGGQKQRVTIARALIMDPRILILDDALASVDTRTENVILDHLDRIMENRTCIIITHRFNALARVDRIFVIDEGRIVETGTHNDLLNSGGIYSELCERQKLKEELEL